MRRPPGRAPYQGPEALARPDVDGAELQRRVGNQAVAALLHTAATGQAGAAPVVDGPAAHRAARAIGAHAFTWQGRVFLGSTLGSPGAPARSEALRHEEHHARQMATPGSPAPVGRLEAEAHRGAGTAVGLAADPDQVLGLWWVIPVVAGLYVLLRPNVANAPAPGDPLQPSVSELQVAGEALALFAVPVGVAGGLARLGYGVVASFGVAGAASSVSFRGVQDVGAGEFSGVSAYLVDAGTGAVIGVVAGGTVRIFAGPATSAAGTTPQLTHLTSEAGHAGITSSGVLRGSQGIYALESSVANRSTAERVLRTLLSPSSTTQSVSIPSNAASLFTRPVPVGPVSLYQRLAGVFRAPAGTIDLATGSFVPTGSRLANITGQFWPYGVDAMLWSAGTATASQLSPATEGSEQRGIRATLLSGLTTSGPSIETRTDGPFEFVSPNVLAPPATPMLGPVGPGAGELYVEPARPAVPAIIFVRRTIPEPGPTPRR